MSNLTERAIVALNAASQKRDAAGNLPNGYVICRLLADDRVNELTPHEIIAGASERLTLISTSLKDGRPSWGQDGQERKAELQEEHAILSKHVLGAKAKLAASPEAEKPKRQAQTDSNTAVSTLEISNEELRRRNEALGSELSELKTTSSETIRRLNARVAELENGDAIKKALQQVAETREALQAADKNVFLLEGLCQIQGIDRRNCVAAARDQSLLAEPKRIGSCQIRQLIKDGKEVPADEQIIQAAQPKTI